MEGVGELPMPAISSDQCVIPSRRTQLGMIGYARMLAGVSGIDPGPAFSSRTPSPPRFVGRRCPPTPVRRLGIGGRRCAHDSSSDDAGPPASQCVHQQTLNGGQENEGLHDHGASPGALSSGADGDNEDGGLDDSGGGQHVGQDQSPRRRARSPPKSAVPARKRYRKGAAHPARVAPIPLGMRKAAEEIARREAACFVMETCLRAAAGLVTVSANFSRGGVCGRIVAAPSSPSRVLFCRLRPALVDVAALWLSPHAKVLCSCRGHNQNVALASTTGRSSTCWHADSFRAAQKRLEACRERLVDALQVKPQTQPHAFTFELDGGRCGLAYDGDIFSPVVASEKRFIWCVAFGCRSMEHRCTHAKLLRALPVFNPSKIRPEPKAIDGSGDEDVPDTEREVEHPKASNDFGQYAVLEDDGADIRACQDRIKRNLLPCREEQKLTELWMRTADVLSATSACADGSAVARGPNSPQFAAFLRFGMVQDPKRVLFEPHCSHCRTKKPEDANLKEERAILYTEHPTAAPIQVRLESLWACICY